MATDKATYIPIQTVTGTKSGTSDNYTLTALGLKAINDNFYYIVKKVQGFLTESDLDEAFVATLRSNTVITNILSAGKANIAELTVDQLDTGTKIQNYLSSDTSDVNYIKIYGQHIQFITATTDGSATEQAEDRNGNPLYWTDGTHAAAGTDVTAYPCMIYDYDELVKLEFTFESDGTYYIPKIILGAGSGNPSYPDYAKGYIYKASDGLYIKYLHSTTGEELVIKLTDDGLDLSDFATLTLKENVVFQGMSQLWVQPDTPTAAKTGDAWIDTDDYTERDVVSLSASTTLSKSGHAGKLIKASGTITLTLWSAATAGECAVIANTGSDIVTLSGTINGETDLLLFPGERADLITDGSGWRC